jgi:hypothetical protein
MHIDIELKRTHINFVNNMNICKFYKVRMINFIFQNLGLYSMSLVEF